MGKALSSSWYETVMTDMTIYGKRTYKTRNDKLARWVKQVSPKRVFEFAGSGGFLAKVIIDTVPGIEFYHHSDFADVAVNFARNLLKDYGNCLVEKIDIDNEYNEVDWGNYDAFITISLEHLDNDLEIINKIPSGRPFFFCVPNFGGKEHVRFFPDENSIIERYSSLLHVKTIEIVPHYPDGKVKFNVWSIVA